MTDYVFEYMGQQIHYNDDAVNAAITVGQRRNGVRQGLPSIDEGGLNPVDLGASDAIVKRAEVVFYGWLATKNKDLSDDAGKALLDFLIDSNAERCIPKPPKHKGGPQCLR